MYWSDFKADTEHLGALETGAYMMLIGHYWNTGGLPDDDIKLARIARMTAEEWAVSKSTIAEFFQDGWKHKRIEQELADANAAYERRANAGRRGGQAKAEASSNAVAMLKQPQPQPQLHISSNEDINITSTSKASDGCAVARQSKRYDDQLLRTTAEAWNELASSVGLATVAKLTDARKVAITRRAKELVDDFDYENPTAGFSELFSKIRGSPFLRGSESSWRCDFDWCFALSNFTKIMEGKYENRPQKVVSFRR